MYKIKATGTVITLNICPSGYLSKILLMVTDRGGRLCPNCSDSAIIQKLTTR